MGPISGRQRVPSRVVLIQVCTSLTCLSDVSDKAPRVHQANRQADRPAREKLMCHLRRIHFLPRKVIIHSTILPLTSRHTLTSLSPMVTQQMAQRTRCLLQYSHCTQRCIHHTHSTHRRVPSPILLLPLVAYPRLPPPLRLISTVKARRQRPTVKPRLRRKRSPVCQKLAMMGKRRRAKTIVAMSTAQMAMRMHLLASRVRLREPLGMHPHLQETASRMEPSTGTSCRLSDGSPRLPLSRCRL